MTDCPRGDMRDLLPDLVHEQLDAATRAEVARHVASCRACAEELELLRSMRRALSPAPHVDVARIAAAVVASRGPSAAPDVRPLHSQQAPRVGRRVAWRIAAGFVVAALALGTWFAAQYRPSHPPVTVAAAPTHMDSVPPAPHATVAPPTAPSHSSAAVKTPATPKMLASTGLVMDGGVKDLSDGDVRMLLQSLDSLSTVPDADPTPMSYQIDDGGVQ